MRSEWRNCTIGDLGTVVGGATPSTKRVENYENGTIAWITPKDLANFNERYISHGERNITEIGLNSCSAQLMPKHSVLFSSRAPIGYVAIASNEVCTNQGFKSVVPNEHTDYLFLYYLLKYNRAKIENLGSGTTFKEVSGTVMKKVPVCVPSLQTQRKIAAVLSSLDDKIELNNAINRNLEQQAQALFKSWFVDFEPFGGKMPEGWKAGTLSEIIADIIVGDWGKDSPTDNNNEMVYCIRGADIPSVRNGNAQKMPIRYIREKNYKAKKLMCNDIVVEISGGSPTQSTGRSAIISDGFLKCYDAGIVCTNFCKAIKPKEKYAMFLYHYWNYLYDRGVLFTYENGTTGIKNLDISSFVANEEIIIPTLGTVDKFNKFCETAFDKIYSAARESAALAALRDSLLPRLMSGEIDLTNA